MASTSQKQTQNFCPGRNSFQASDISETATIAKSNQFRHPSTMMKLGFQGWFLLEPYTGIGQHSIGLLRALAKQKSVTCTVPVPKKTKIEGIPSSWLKVLKPKSWIPSRGLKKWYWEAVQVPQFFEKQSLDWEYYPYPCPIPKYSPTLRALTVHDLIAWQDPRYTPSKLKSVYYRFARHSIVRADQIFTVSQTVKEELGLPNAKVIYNAAPPAPKKSTASPHPSSLVYLGGFDIRKNVPLLLEAYKKVRNYHPDLNLVLIGQPHFKSRYYPEVKKAPGVILAGALPPGKVHALLKDSFAFVHFSDSEGFNIPLLEAMTVGTPAIVADIKINREISANKALFIRPSHPKDLLDIIEKLKNEKTRQSVVKKQKERARDFSWERSAKELLQTLKQ
ncbi:glycosyltransferase family 4 protein [Patescibacteria group bacterium]|nr:glycosyltransferase family 4 protein [Patescibacteria group bacterium]